MTDAADKLDFCKQALGDIGTRSTITSIDPPDGSTEAFYCNLFFNGVRDQILRAANWNFAGRTDVGILWKALPGTPENPTVPSSYEWSYRDPAPPWLYAYMYPPYGCAQIRRIRGQTLVSGVPMLGDRAGSTEFEVAGDRFDGDGTWLYATQTVISMTTVNAGLGYLAGDYITMTQDGASFGQPFTVQVNAVAANGSVIAPGIRTGGTFAVHNTNVFTQISTTGEGTGFTCNGTFEAHPGMQKVCLTNAQNILIDFTSTSIVIAEFDPLFGDAFMLALSGKLALALMGDRQLYIAKMQEANNAIITARVRDGNEGLTRYENVPDWLQVRGVASISPPSWHNPPYGPLFAV